MNRLNAEVIINDVDLMGEEEKAPQNEEAYPLYKGNLIYLPFARHLADEEEDEEPLDRAA